MKALNQTDDLDLEDAWTPLATATAQVVNALSSHGKHVGYAESSNSRTGEAMNGIATPACGLDSKTQVAKISTAATRQKECQAR